MPMTQVITYYAARPFKALHPPDETGVVVQYNPGDVVPAEEWGASANWLKEAGKIFPTAENVWVDDLPQTVPASEQIHAQHVPEGPYPPSGPDPALHPFEEEEPLVNPLVDENAPFEKGVHYPLHEGAGWYQLSDGSRVRGKVNATAAEAALEGSDE